VPTASTAGLVSGTLGFSAAGTYTATAKLYALAPPPAGGPWLGPRTLSSRLGPRFSTLVAAARRS
jgi:hypothetical protein